MESNAGSRNIFLLGLQPAVHGTFEQIETGSRMREHESESITWEKKLSILPVPSMGRSGFPFGSGRFIIPLHEIGVAIEFYFDITNQIIVLAQRLSVIDTSPGLWHAGQLCEFIGDSGMDCKGRDIVLLDRF